MLTTIRSRTHHYPFRLIPPGVLRAHLGAICAEEGITVEPAVLPLVVRAGGGSARDSLSILDQLLAGAGPEGVTYARAVAPARRHRRRAARRHGRRAGGRRRGRGVRRRSTASSRPATIRAGSPPTCSTGFRDLILLDAVPDAAARGPDRRAAGPGSSGWPTRRAARRGDADPVRRDRPHRADRDARDDLAAAGARAAVRPDAAARARRRDRRAAAAARTAGAPTVRLRPARAGGRERTLPGQLRPALEQEPPAAGRANASPSPTARCPPNKAAPSRPPCRRRGRSAAVAGDLERPTKRAAALGRLAEACADRCRRAGPRAAARARPRWPGCRRPARSPPPSAPRPRRRRGQPSLDGSRRRTASADRPDRPAAPPAAVAAAGREPGRAPPTSRLH